MVIGFVQLVSQQSDANCVGPLPWASTEIFPGGAKSTLCLSFSGCWRCKQMLLQTVAYSVFPGRKLCTEQMFVLVSMDILRLS